MELDDRLLPARANALERAAPLRLRLHRHDVHVQDTDVEELLDGLADLRLVRVLMHLERVLAVGDHRVALLADDRRQKHLACMQRHLALHLIQRAKRSPGRMEMRQHFHPLALPWTSGSAASLTSSARAQTTAATSSSDGDVTRTRSRFRKLFSAAVS